MIADKMMARAVEISKNGTSKVFPNPKVGAVIFDDDGNILAEGWHEEFGKAHAEINALKNLKVDAKGLNMAVSLEPCNHFGKTPPCSHAIVEAGLKKVFIAVRDFGKKAKGGAEYLKEHGVEVEFLPKFESEVREINKFFFKTLEYSLPFVALKMATSLDGFISSQKNIQTKITGKDSLIEVHKLRSNFMSVAVGANTVNIDNPSLNVRFVDGKNPFPVIFSKNLNLDCSKNIFNKEVLVFTSVSANKIPKCFFNKKVVFETIDVADDLFLTESLKILWKKYSINSVLIEGGSKLASSFVSEDIIDEFHLFIAPVFLTGGVPCFNFFSNQTADKKDFQLKKVKQIKNDIYAIFSKKRQFS